MTARYLDFGKFAVVGAGTWVVDTAVFLVLKDTVLQAKPVTAKVIAVLVAVLVSYCLSRAWSFRPRRALSGSRESSRFFAVSGIAIGFYAAPLWISRYVLDLKEPAVSLLTQEIADFVSGQIVGVAVGMMFRWWAFNHFVFPGPDPGAGAAPRRGPRAHSELQRST